MPGLDPEVARRFQAGDLEALRQVVEQYQARIFRLGLRLLGSEAEAADFAQDSFLKAFEKRRTYDCRRPFEPWFYKVSVNVGRGRLRRRREWPMSHAFPEQSAEAGQDRMLIAEEEKNRVQRALQRMAPKYREALALRFHGGLSLREIARSLGIPQGTVKSRLSRGLLIFQKVYAGLGGEAA